MLVYGSCIMHAIYPYIISIILNNSKLTKNGQKSKVVSHDVRIDDMICMFLELFLLNFCNVVFPHHSTFFISFFRTMLRQQVIHLASTKYDKM